MRWWCVAVDEPWSWAPRPYFGVWAMCLAIVGWYAVSIKRHGGSVSRKQVVWFALGLLFLWMASDWPVGSLGAGYLASIHMLQYMLYTLAAAPLLMLGTPDWMFERLLRRRFAEHSVEVLSRPVVAGILFNIVLVATHAPVTVDSLRTTQVGNFALDMIWLASGFLLWLPVISPAKRFRASSAGARIVYLFLAAALIPMIPGGFVAFSPQPLYATYELAPRLSIDGPSALGDQQMAGVLMKVGNVPIIWAVMAVIWFRWYDNEQRRSRDERLARQRTPRTDGSGRRPTPDRAVPPAGAAPLR
ncbi:MAG: cytochrome c oxidase assembly protein [Actinomycetota bacterium]